MMLKPFVILSLCAALVLPVAAQAQDTLVNPDVQQALDETNQALLDSAAQMDKTIKKIMPEVTSNMTEMMINIFNTFPPLMEAVERSQILSKASKQLNQEIKTSAEQLNAAVAADMQNSAAALPSLSQTEPVAFNEFVISGSKDENGRRLDFNFSQDNKTILNAEKMFDYISAPEPQGSEPQITTLEGTALPPSAFKLERINGSYYLVSSPDAEHAFITGNLNAKVNLKVQTSGPDALLRARAFVKDFKPRMIK